MGVNIEFWTEKKVLVTGHTGFVGSWMCVILKYLGADVYGLALEPETESLYIKAQIASIVTEYIQDICEYENVKAVIDSVKPEIVIHLAAFGFVKECNNNPSRAYMTNVIGTVNILEAIRTSDSVSNVLIVSSDKVYQNDESLENHYYQECEKLGGSDPYSCSKTCEDMIAQSYFFSYYKGMNKTLNIVRPGNIIGGGDHIKSRLIPGMLEKFGNNEVVDIRHPYATRPWQHILDAVDAYLSIIKKSFNSDVVSFNVYNVGPEKDGQMSVGEIAKYISQKFDHPKLKLGEKTFGVREAEYLGVDIKKLKEEIQWKPQKNMREILDDCYDFWEKGQIQDQYDLCIEQIENYYGR